MNIKEVSDISSQIGFLLLSHGADMYRVEDTISRIAKSYGAKAEVFAIPNSLIVTISSNDGKTFTQTKRVYISDSNLDLVDCINSLARKICKETPAKEEVFNELEVVLNRPVYNVPTQLLGGALGAGGFSVLLGGYVSEFFVAAICGVLIRIALIFMGKLKSGSLLTNIVGGAICAGGCIIMSLFIKINVNIAIISSLMLLVPGLVMTNAIRNIIAGDTVSGIMKISEAAFIATGIAIGVICAVAVLQSATGVII